MSERTWLRVFSGADRRKGVVSSRAAEINFGDVNPGWRTSEIQTKRADVLTLGYYHITPDGVFSLARACIRPPAEANFVLGPLKKLGPGFLQGSNEVSVHD